MKKQLIIASTLILMAGPAQAQWEPPSDVLQVLGKGDGAWAMRCDWQSSKGKAMVSETKGTAKGTAKGWARLHLLNAADGQCSYQAAPDKPLRVALRSPLYVCSLPAPDAKTCEQTFPAGATGQFDIWLRN